MNRRIREIAGKEKMRVVGLMSGTSADGVDAAVVEIDRGKVRLLAFEMFAYPAALRRQILGLCTTSEYDHRRKSPPGGKTCTYAFGQACSHLPPC